MRNPFPPTARNRKAAAASAGFTITELFITAFIMAVIIAGGAIMMVSHIRQSAIQESTRRLHDEWGRMNYFISGEITEAASASIVPNTSLTLTLPSGQTISYSFDATTRKLTRTGPPVKNNGQLDLTTSSTVDFLTNITAFTPTLTNSREPSYAITLTDGRGNVFTGLSSAERTRTSSYP